QLPTLPEVRMYYGTAQKTLDQNLTFKGVRYPGPYFTFNQQGTNTGFLVVDTDNSCNIADLVRTLLESSETARTISFQARERTPAVLELESCPRLEARNEQKPIH
ncbi:MAG: hypothetical protein AABX69_05110, partial [Nanoarchaeota archaeon]